MDICQALSSWDGKSSSDIQSIYAHYQLSPGFINQLLAMITANQETIGVTWLLKYYLEQNGPLSTRQVKTIYNNLSDIKDWEARLHILQSLPYMPVPAESRKIVEIFIRKGLTDSNKFIRSWSYNGFYELCIQFPELQQEALGVFHMALNDEAASVKARIKIILKKGF